LTTAITNSDLTIRKNTASSDGFTYLQTKQGTRYQLSVSVSQKHKIIDAIVSDFVLLDLSKYKSAAYIVFS